MDTRYLLLSYQRTEAETAARLGRALAERGLTVGPANPDDLPGGTKRAY